MRSLRRMLLACVIAGCAHAPSRVASAAAYLCKHCNCFMPADADMNKTCPVCRCGYPAHACRRGER